MAVLVYRTVGQYNWRMARKSKKEYAEELKNHVETMWQIYRLRKRNRDKYDALFERLKGKPIWKGMPGNKASDQEVEDWAMRLPLPYSSPTYEQAYKTTIKAAYAHQGRSEPPFLYYHRMKIPVYPVTLALPQVFKKLRALKTKIKSLNGLLDCRDLLELEDKINISFSPLAEREDVLEKVSEAFRKINEAHIFTRTMRPQVFPERWKKCFEVYEAHQYGKVGLEDIAAKRRQKPWESPSAARRRIQKYYDAAEEFFKDEQAEKNPFTQGAMSKMNLVTKKDKKGMRKRRKK
jgi:hypothetical protein